MAIIKALLEIKELVKLSRSDLYKQVKPTIDAANKRLKRQGSDVKLSTKGLSKDELLNVAKQAVKVQNKRDTFKQSNVTKQSNITKQPRTSKVVKQLPQNFEKMKRDEFVKKLQPTIDAANKRLKRLENMKTLSPALNSVMESGGKFSLKGKDRNAAIKEASRAITFINMKTSTISGAKQFEQSFQKKLSNKAQGITNDQRKLLFDSFRKLEQISPVGLNIYGSDRLIRLLADEVVDEKYDFNNAMNKALNELTKAYEDYQSEYDELDPFDL